MQQDQVDQAYNYILKKITESDILEKTDVNHLMSKLKEKYSISMELAFVIIVRAWYSSDCHVRLINIPKFSHQNDLLEEKTESPQIFDTTKAKATHDKILVSPGIPEDQNLVTNEFDIWFKSLDKTSLDKKQLQAKLHKKVGELAETASQTIKVQTKQKGEFYIPKLTGLIKRFQKCYKKGCRCMKGHPHGPYYYLRVYINGKDVQIYLGRAPR